jgi:hypothetical protein
MNKEENPLTELQKKFDHDDVVDIVEVTINEMKTIGFVIYFFKIKPFIKPYLFWTSVVTLLLIAFGNASLWSFFVPAIPIAILLILFLIDFFVISYSLVKAQRKLQTWIKQEIGWDDMIHASLIAMAIREPTEDEDENMNMPY